MSIGLFYHAISIGMCASSVVTDKLLKIKIKKLTRHTSTSAKRHNDDIELIKEQSGNEFNNIVNINCV